MLRTVRRGAVPLPCCLAAALLAAQSANADPATPAASSQTSKPPAELWATQLQFDNNGTPWAESFFASVKAAGINEAELDMPWGSLEPTRLRLAATNMNRPLIVSSVTLSTGD